MFISNSRKEVILDSAGRVTLWLLLFHTYIMDAVAFSLKGFCSFRKTLLKATIADFSSETSSKSEEEEEQPERRPKSDFYLSSEFLQIKKLVKYLKV